jgi:hypothetical protein
MIKEILEAQPGIIFRDDPRLADMGVILNPRAPAAMKAEGSGGEDARTSPNIVAAAPSTEEGADVTRPDGPEQDDAPSPHLPVDALWGDVVAPENDRLRNPLWWVLEFIPFMTGYQDEHDRWHNHLRCVSCTWEHLF